MQFRGLPLLFDQHAFDGARAEGLTEDDVLDVLEHGKEVRRARGRVQVEQTSGRTLIIVRYAEREEDSYVFSVSRRSRR